MSPGRWRYPAHAFTALLCLLGGLAVARAQDALPRDHFDLQLTVEQSRGDYAEESTTRIRTAALVVRYRSERWVAEVQLPWVEAFSDQGNGGLPDTVGRGGSRERGLGDIWLKAGLELRELSREQTGIDLTFKLKTRSGNFDRGLGTGATDLAGQIELTKMVGQLTLFGHVGYRITGDVSGAPAYRDPWYGELGASWRLGERLEAGAFVDAREPIGRLGSARDATLYTALRDGRQRVELYVSRGFADASADVAVGLTWRTRF
jgi:hypothetical protein